MYYRFIPRLPSKAAWDTKPFNTHHSLQSIVEALKERLKEKKMQRYQVRGELAQSADALGTFFYSIEELEERLQALKWDMKKVKTVYIFDLGYFEASEGTLAP
jgi:hypothetical protein